MSSKNDHEFSTSEARLDRLVALGKLWADAALFHPFLAHCNIDWDKAFVETIPKLETSKSNEQYLEAITSMLSVLQDPQTDACMSGFANLEQAKTVNKPSAASKSMTKCQRKPLQVTEDSIAIIDFKDVSAKESWTLSRELALEQIAEKDFRALVLDMRNEKDLWVDTDSLLGDLARQMCRERAVGPTLRSRIYCGFAPEEKTNGGHYFSGYCVRDAFTVKPKLPAIQVPIIFLTNKKTRIPMAALALQSQSNVFILSVGQPGEKQLGVDKQTYTIPGGIVANLRLGEWVFPDGHIGFIPDKILTENDQATEDKTLNEAILFAGSNPQKLPCTSGYAIAGTETAFQKYMDMIYPPKPYRLLALFRIWSIFNYFFPYKDIMEEDWEQVLRDFIPRFENVQNAKEYDLAVCEMIARVHDSHAGVYGGVLGEFFGYAQPPIRCRIVEGQPVVTEVRVEDIAEKNDITCGDIVKAVDGIDVQTLLSKYSKYISASTPQSLEGQAVEGMLSGAEGSTTVLQLEDCDGKLKTVDLLRKSSYWEASFWYLDENFKLSDDEMFKPISEGKLGYCDLRKLIPDKVDEMFERFKNTKGIIFDMRGYPQLTLGPIAERLTSKERVIAGIHSKPLVSRPYGTTMRNFQDEVHHQNESSTFLLIKSPSSLPAYKGKTVMLIDDRAISQAEQTGLFFKAANNTKFVGSATAGANGTMTNFWVPGGLCIGFTGELICYPDGTQLQRRGLQPDVSVKPTIAGIRAGKDEVLDKAIEYLAVEVDLS